MERIARFVYKRSRLIIVLVVILNIAALGSFFRFELDTDFLSFFYEGNPKAEEFHRLNEKYQIGDTIVVLIEQNESLLSEENLQAVYELQEEIEGLGGVYQVQSFIPPKISVQGRIYPVRTEKKRKPCCKSKNAVENFRDGSLFKVHSSCTLNIVP